MNKKLINEDIKNMKYLFGYKAGRVISEQDFDYTTDDYLDTEIDENGKPERLVKHKNTNKIVGSHKKGEGFRPSPHGEKLGFKHHPMDIPHGTKFGGTEVGDFDYEEMTENKDDLFLRRRSSAIESLIDKYINEVEEEGTSFSDEYEFADNIISWVVSDMTTSDYSNHDYDELTDLIKDNFGDYILSQYSESDFDEEMDEGYEYDDVDETNPDDVEDDTFGDFDLSKLNLDDEDDESNDYSHKLRWR